MREMEVTERRRRRQRNRERQRRAVIAACIIAAVLAAAAIIYALTKANANNKQNENNALVATPPALSIYAPLALDKPHIDRLLAARAAVADELRGIVVNPFEHKEPEALAIDAEYVYVADIETGEVYYEKSADTQCFPASTTKILTAMTAIANMPLNAPVRAGTELSLVLPRSSVAGLVNGDEADLHIFLEALMLPSGNDAAYTIAVNVARYKLANETGYETGYSGENTQMSDEYYVAFFCGLMNDYAASIGATSTHFTAPDGFHDPEHYTTAKDMFIISREAMKNEIFRQIVSTTYVTEQFYSGRQIEWRNGNQLINAASDNYYRLASGVKTGFHNEAGYCLIAAGEFEGRNVLSVVLNAEPEKRWDSYKNALRVGFFAGLD